MPQERLSRIWASMSQAGEDRRASITQLCRACADEMEVSGAALALVLAGQHRGALAASDGWVSAAEDLQFTLGEGPGLDVYASPLPVIEADLAGTVRWPLYRPEALASGIAAVFAVPLQLGGARFGALSLYRDRPGPLAEGAVDDLVLVAQLATAVVMDTHNGGVNPAISDLAEDMLDRRAVVHQATGRISVQLGVTLEEALLALRARAFSDGVPIIALAEEVAAGRIRFGK